MLRADNLTFAYSDGDRPYVFSLEAAPGEVTAISGPCVSGKSTLLDLLAGFAQPKSGTLTLDGVDLQVARGGQREDEDVGIPRGRLHHLAVDLGPLGVVVRGAPDQEEAP